MTPEALESVRSWVTAEGLAGTAEPELLAGFCRRCRDAGLELSRALAIIDTLHPIYEGRAFQWRETDTEVQAPLEYGSTSGGDAARDWQRSAFYHLLATGGDELRRRIGLGDPLDFGMLERLKGEGVTDYVAMVHRFGQSGSFGEMDGVYSHWASSRPAGFSDAEIAALRSLLPTLVLAIKTASLARVATTLVEVYLGRDAGRRVLSGSVSRGVAERIHAVLWFSDLRGYTSISGSSSPDEIIPFLNDYAEAVVSAVHGAGGDVLKLIGDGALAIFKSADPGEAALAALSAEADLRRRTAELNQRRVEEGRPVTAVYLGLHVGEVFYGNIGGRDRLDFTVVGPAVNEVSRIVAMCRAVERSVVVSSAFAAAVPEPDRDRLVSVGRFALRGVERPQHLFTLDGSAQLKDEED